MVDIRRVFSEGTCFSGWLKGSQLGASWLLQLISIRLSVPVVQVREETVRHDAGYRSALHWAWQDLESARSDGAACFGLYLSLFSRSKMGRRMCWLHFFLL